jgi:hypothetical protein
MGHQWSRFAMPSAAVMLRGTCFAGAAGGDSGGRRRGGGGVSRAAARDSRAARTNVDWISAGRRA